ncbi:hypothetical protein L596_009694 [Steinernema carpocapsae]|uniref:Uncharacterized protein n=1 Tax=Steinernema carpocapsae TaxID=34508 RepID=A0A4U5PGE7_STECR|nr:hypothetical protein L596_009694 [Steinernema carpocapsae]
MTENRWPPDCQPRLRHHSPSSHRCPSVLSWINQDVRDPGRVLEHSISSRRVRELPRVPRGKRRPLARP